MNDLKSFTRDIPFMKKGEYPLPFFPNQPYVVALACDINYLPYVLILIENIIETTPSNNFCDIIVEVVDIDNEIIEMCLNSFPKRNNISIRFLDHFYYLKSKDIYLGFHGYATYAKLRVSETFQSYKKVLCLDSDLLVLKDINLFFDIELDNNYLVAAKDFPMNVMFLENRASLSKITSLDKDLSQKNIQSYYEEDIKLDNDYMINHYFNCGVVLFNIEKMREDNIFKEIDLLLDSHKKFWIVDQDFLNYIFKDKKIKIVDYHWIAFFYKKEVSKHINLVNETNIKYLEESMLCTPVLFHFLVSLKPWDFLLPNDKFSLKYWQIASKSFLYPLVLKKYLERNIKEDLEEKIFKKTFTYKIKNSLRKIKRFLFFFKRNNKK